MVQEHYMAESMSSAEMEEYKAVEALELKLLEKLKAGGYEVVQHVEVGELASELHRRPGLNRLRLWWDFGESPIEMPIINISVIVDDETFFYDGLLDEWINEELGFVIDEMETWLNENIDTDYSSQEKLFKLMIPNEEAAEDYLADLDYFDIDGKLFFYVPEDIADEPFTEIKQKNDADMMARAKKLTYSEAIKRFLAGDYEMVPEDEF